MPVTQDDALLIDGAEAARLTNVSKRHWLALCKAGRTPRPIHLGRSTRWRLDELKSWLAAGAPNAEDWYADQQRRAGQ